MNTKLHEEGFKIIDSIAKKNPTLGYELLKGFMGLLDVGCGSELDDKTNKLKTAQDKLEDIIIEMIKETAELTKLRDLIKAGSAMKCGGS